MAILLWNLDGGTGDRRAVSPSIFSAAACVIEPAVASLQSCSASTAHLPIHIETLRQHHSTNMASTRLRKAFRYPTDSDSDSDGGPVEGIDEEG